MSDEPEWFAPKRYGYGAGRPISWQGWAVTLLFGVTVTGLSLLLKNQPLPLAAIMLPLIAVFIAICARTTRGGWRWRWGDPD